MELYGVMRFEKYAQRGAYHWAEYEAQTTYGKYAGTLPEWITERPLLDIGAGDGLITSLLQCVGIDDNEEAVALAQEKGVKVVLGSAYELPFEKGDFKAIFMGDVIEHLETPDVALKEIVRVLEDGGYLYITTPKAREDRQLQDPFHYREYTPEELDAFITSFGFVSVEPITENYARMYAKYRLISSS